MSAILELQGLRRAFGSIRAVDGVDLCFGSPGIYGLIGPNGAGKTTLFDLITGRQATDAGEIRYRGQRMDGLPAHRRARAGFARTFQECRVLVEESCLDNLLFAAQDKRLGGALLRVLARRASAGRAAREEAFHLLELVNLTRFAHQPAGALSYGQRRLLEIASAVMSHPGLLLLDEPAAGVNPTLINTLHDLLLRIHRERGISLVVVEHNMPFIMSLASTVVVLHQGKVLQQGTPESVQADPRVVEAYLG